MSKPTIEQTRMGAEGIAFCIARTLIERDPSLKAPIRMFELGHNADWSRTMRSQQFNLRVPAGCRFLPLAG